MREGLRTAAVGLTLALIAALAVPFAAAEAPPAKLVVTAYYKTGAGNLALEGVEVFAFVGGVPMWQCTNSSGKAVFEAAVGETVTVLATGPGRVGVCPNWEYLNPDDGRKMFTVFYKNHQGVRIFDPILLSDSRQAVKLIAKTPNAQPRVCLGMKVTMLGSKFNDTIDGTGEGDVINSRGGNDTVHGYGGDDLICGGPGEDDLYGDDDNDWIAGEGAADMLDGGGGSDTLWGGPGKDVCVEGESLDSCNE